MNHPAPVGIAYRNLRFLIVHSPTNASLNKFLQELKNNGIATIGTICEATYHTDV